MRLDNNFIIILILLVSTVSSGKIIYVDDDGPADFNNIQAAIDDANDGDTILVMDGTYSGKGNRDIDFKGKAITVKSQNGPDTCIIDCQGTAEEPHRGFYFHNNEDANSVVQGFTIIGGYIYGTAWEKGGGIGCNESSPKIEDCIVIGNEAWFGGGIASRTSTMQVINCIIKKNIAMYGGGISIGSNDNGKSLINHCIVAGNYAQASPRMGGDGGGILVESNADIINCTITNNISGYVGGGICFKKGGSHISNTIIWGNQLHSDGGNEVALWYNYDPRYYNSTNLFIGNSFVGIGVENDFVFLSNNKKALIGEWLHGDPCFASPSYWDPNRTIYDPDFWIEGDYHLKSQAGRFDPNTQTWIQDDITSPCIDAGDPNSPIGYEPFPNGGRINMGAYGGTAEASKSYFGKPVCTTIIAGDINGDCKVDVLDFEIMLLHWLEEH